MTELQICAGSAVLSSLEDEREQVERAKRDPKAFAGLYRMHCRAVAGYVYRRTGDEHATEDIVSEVFLAALRHLPRYRHRGVPIRYWLYRIATNVVNRWVRRRRSGLAVDVAVDLDERAAAGDNGEHVATRGIAQQAMLRLSPKHQAVLSLHYLEGLSVEEVAAVVGCRIGTVKSRLSRAREALRYRLEGRR